MPVGGLQGEFITERPETKQAAACDVTEITIVAKFFSGKSIAQVHFDKRNLNGQKSIAQRNTRVREATGVQDDKFNVVDGGLLDPVDELMFGITLETNKVMSELFGEGNAALFDVGEIGRTVNIGFTRTEQVQVGSVDKQKRGHFEGFAAR